MEHGSMGEDAPFVSPDVEDVYNFARAVMAAREFRRAAALTAPLLQSPKLSSPDRHKVFFLHFYATYLDVLRMAEANRSNTYAADTQLAYSASENGVPSMSQLLDALEEQQTAHGLDAFGLYLLGAVLREMKRKADARTALLAAATAYPWNWSAWLDLAALCEDASQIEALSLPQHGMALLFKAHALIEAQAVAPALDLLQQLAHTFPGCSTLVALTGRAEYVARNFDAAEEAFQSLSEGDKFRLDVVDVYSNVLYVKNKVVELAALAQMALEVDRYRPETCCVIGNYYSMRGAREKAVLYFRRALRLNPQYLEAWTLMGHEYVELKNTAAAVECYRRAATANPRDYRAWYGLGQTYELLQLYRHAEYYYRRATVLRPYDSRMWCALGVCHEQLKRPAHAVACFSRAHACQDSDGTALLRLARVHKQEKLLKPAARYYHEYVDACEKRGGAAVASPDMAEALLFLANLALAVKQYAAACTLATKVMYLPLPAEVNEARAILTVARMREEAAAAGTRGDTASLLTMQPSPGSKATNMSGVSLGTSMIGGSASGVFSAQSPSEVLARAVATSAAAAAGAGDTSGRHAGAAAGSSIAALLLSGRQAPGSAVSAHRVPAASPGADVSMSMLSPIVPGALFREPPASAHDVSRLSYLGASGTPMPASSSASGAVGGRGSLDALGGSRSAAAAAAAAGGDRAAAAADGTMLTSEYADMTLDMSAASSHAGHRTLQHDLDTAADHLGSAIHEAAFAARGVSAAATPAAVRRPRPSAAPHASAPDEASELDARALGFRAQGGEGMGRASESVAAHGAHESYDAHEGGDDVEADHEVGDDDDDNDLADMEFEF